jgi:lysophospholipase L1-like esterase
VYEQILVGYGEAQAADAVADTRLDYVEATLASSLDSGLAECETMTVERETTVRMDDCTTQGATPSQAYGNGATFAEEVRVTGFKLLSTITATQFGLFVFDKTNNLVRSVANITPTVTDGVYCLDDPLTVPKGGYVLIRFLNGVFFYDSLSASSLKEYRPGTGEMMASPIKVGVNFVYTAEYKNIKFKADAGLPALKLQDYSMPRFVVDSSAEYTYIGRWFDHVVDGKTYKAANADGSSLAFRVKGATKLNVGFYTITAPAYTPYFAYSIDGGDFVRQKITDTSIPVPDTSEHWIWIVVDGMGENDPVAGGKWYGSVGVYFVGTTTDGQVQGASAANKRILFIGDSIVEGINVLGEGANANTNSATKGFAFKTARKLNAIPLLCGYGGTAVLGNSSFHKPIEAIDYNLQGVEVNDQNPDVVLIEHGYNDGTLVSSGAYTENDFKAGYNALIDRIKTKYPGVLILCMVPFKQSLASAIKGCAAGRAYCQVIETDGWGVTYTDAAHPNEAGADVAAEKLADAIAGIFGKAYFMT